MTTPSTTGQSDASLARDLVYAARYYLGRPRVLIALASLAIVAGLALNWSWLVAAGLAPIIISTLPCLIMCAFGVCMMCRSAKEQSTPTRGMADPAMPPTTVVRDAVGLTAPTTLLPASAPDDASAGVASCCHAPTSEAKSSQVIDRRIREDGKLPNA